MKNSVSWLFNTLFIFQYFHTILTTRKFFVNSWRRYNFVYLFASKILIKHNILYTEAVTRSVILKKVFFLKIAQNSLENTLVGVSLLIKLQDWGLQLY